MLTVSCRSPREGSSPHTRGAHQERAGRGHQCGIIPAYAGSTTRPITTLILIPGSSPHTRGARQAATHTLALRRIIPAYAGSTTPTLSTGMRTTDHPRIRGEHRFDGGFDRGALGSSPHTRGALPNAAPRMPTSADHPRIRGEHAGWDDWQLGREGSSPHTRGARGEDPGGAAATRIIPAYAGSTISRSNNGIFIPDHPRIRGEHKFRSPDFNAARGSSPHTRGAPPHRERPFRWGGIIPAYAGSTRRHVCLFYYLRDHPRIRGEHEDEAEGQGQDCGSSPHTRGAHTRFSNSAPSRRIIPAYAGSTTPPTKSP